MEHSLKQEDAPSSSRNVDPNRLLYSLMIPAIMMPLAGWMFSVSLPTIRDDFGIQADSAAWIATAFSLPFMLFMPVYGRLSDSLGKRRLLLAGITLFVFGGLMATFSTSLAMLILGRFLQGVGVAGNVPLSLALISEVFAQQDRGKAMGLWSTMGPITGVVGPVLAGLIVARWGWRGSFIPPLFFGVLGLAVIFWMIPSSGRPVSLDFLRRFDWIGTLLLFATLTFLFFYLSSRPITGVPPLQDWRFLALMLIFGVGFVLYENVRDDPFINLRIFGNRTLMLGSALACLRMIGLSGGMGFLMPLYLADIINIDPSLSGFFLMANPAAMVICVRLAGGLADRWGSRLIVMTGFAIVGSVYLTFSQLGASTPYWGVILLYFCFGIGAGMMLATLHRAALNDVPDVDMGTSSGIYSMLRFLGSALGAAIGGILLKYYTDLNPSDLLAAFQSVFVWYVGFALLGILIAFFLPRSSSA
ncbi:MAG: MFS transporter [Chloroflexota bacterium]